VLTRQLLTFGRKHDPRVTRVELGATISALGDMLARVIREDIVLTMDLGRERIVLIDPYDLEQVVFNLVMNARDALPRGGTIHVSVDLSTVDDAIGAGDHPVTPGEYIRLRVQDNGVGMTPDVQAHLFEPFFTTEGRRGGDRPRPGLRPGRYALCRRLRDRRQRASAGNDRVGLSTADRRSRRCARSSTAA
jgi:signal transduction histidine kinase